MQLGARSTGGLVKVVVTTSGSGYDAPPAVSFQGGGGTGATAYAHMAGTLVQSIVIHSQGTGFTASPTVSVLPQSAAVTVDSVTASSTNTVVTLTTSAATTYAQASFGSGIVPIAAFQNGTQFSVNATTGIGTGAATLYRSGTGAAATAFAHTGPLRPVTFFKGRYADMYGVDGMGRGFRWDGAASSVQPIGLVKPAVGPGVTAASTSSGAYVKSIQIIAGGVGYSSEPTVVFSGGSPSSAARARASISGGRVTEVVVTEPGRGYQSAPSVSFTGGMGSGVSLQVGVLGSVSALTLTSSGAGYTTSPSVTAATGTYLFSVTNHGLSAGSSFSFSSLSGGNGLTVDTTYYAVSVGANTFTAGTTAGTTASTDIFTTSITAGRIVIPPPRIVFDSTRGLTGAAAEISVSPTGLGAVVLLAGGTGATTTGVTAAVVGGGGTGAALAVGLNYSVSAVTAASSGSGYMTAPVITFRAAADDTFGSGAAATAAINGLGNVTGATVYAGGQYTRPPTALIVDTQARAVAELATPLRGRYGCCVRYIDGTEGTPGGPKASSISHITYIDAEGGASSLSWSFQHFGLDDRVQKMELWRTTADQSVILFRVATIARSDPEFFGTYIDTIQDSDLKSTARAGYGLMPVTLPSGQINARRFEVPAGEFCVACMFQDRAWYAVDSSGTLPNSLFYSEIDEPESVPSANELVVQENTGDPDKVVALIPLGGYLLIAQESHLYKLSYVAQPVIDASILLVGYRGILNSRCWDVMGGVAFIVDGSGMYAFDGGKEEALSVAVDNFWRDNVIDFTKASQFHVRCDMASRTVRFFYCKSSDEAPVRALCYCIATEAWWEEQYPHAVTATCPVVMHAKRTVLSGTGAGALVRAAGLDDLGAAVSYAYRSGAMPLTNEDGSRSVSVVYNPTLTDCALNLRLHYNNSATPRANAISSDRGSGFVATQGATGAQLNMKRTRSALGDATGFARAYYSGRVDDKSAGGDRHIAIAVDGLQAGTTPDDAVTIYGLSVDGAS